MSKGHWRPLLRRSRRELNTPVRGLSLERPSETTLTKTKWDIKVPNIDRSPRWSQVGYFRCESPSWHSHSPSRDAVNNSGNGPPPYWREVQPYKSVRVRKRHKERERIHSSIESMGGPGSGPIVSRRNIKSSDVSGRIAAALNKLFRSKSQRSRRVLEYLQLDLLGHVIKTPTYLRETAKFLCIREGIVRVYKKPSFKAVRCLLSIIKDCETTSYQIGTCLRHFALCIP